MRLPARLSRSTLFFACLFVSGVCAQCPQPEFPIDVSTLSEPYPIFYGAHSVGAAITTPAESDTFEFEGSPSDVVRFMVRSNANYLDPRLEIIPPDGISAITTIGACSSGCCDQCVYFAEHPLSDFSALSGTYTLIVSDSGANDTGGYTVQLELIPPTTIDSCLIPLDSFETGTLSPTLDHDYYEFEAVAGSLVRVGVTSTSNYLDPLLEIYDPSGLPLVNVSCSSGCCDQCSTTSDLAIIETGTYLMVMRDSGLNDTGGYRIELSCLFPAGACSVAPSDFIRGDCNDDATVDLSDSIQALNTLFTGAPPPQCSDACDVNDDGVMDISDSVYALAFLFVGGPGIPEPVAVCGGDPTPDALGCTSSCP